MLFYFLFLSFLKLFICRDILEYVFFFTFDITALSLSLSFLQSINLILLVHPSSFLAFFTAGFFFDQPSCHKKSQFLFSHHMAGKKLLDFFAVHEIRNMSQKKHISIGTSFLCICFEIVYASQPYVGRGSIADPKALLLVWMEMSLFVYTNFFLWKLSFACAIPDAISLLFRP